MYLEKGSAHLKRICCKIDISIYIEEKTEKRRKQFDKKKNRLHFVYDWYAHFLTFEGELKLYLFMYKQF